MYTLRGQSFPRRGIGRLISPLSPVPIRGATLAVNCSFGDFGAIVSDNEFATSLRLVRRKPHQTHRRLSDTHGMSRSSIWSERLWKDCVSWSRKDIDRSRSRYPSNGVFTKYVHESLVGTPFEELLASVPQCLRSLSTVKGPRSGMPWNFARERTSPESAARFEGVIHKIKDDFGKHFLL